MNRRFCLVCQKPYFPAPLGQPRKTCSVSCNEKYRKDYNRKRYLEHREEARANQREYRLRDPEAYRERQRKRYAANIEHGRELRRQFYHKNRERLKERQRQIYARKALDPDWRESEAIRNMERARKQRAIVAHFKQMMEVKDGAA